MNVPSEQYVVDFFSTYPGYAYTWLSHQLSTGHAYHISFSTNDVFPNDDAQEYFGTTPLDTLLLMDDTVNTFSEVLIDILKSSSEYNSLLNNTGSIDTYVVPQFGNSKKNFLQFIQSNRNHPAFRAYDNSSKSQGGDDHIILTNGSNILAFPKKDIVSDLTTPLLDIKRKYDISVRTPKQDKHLNIVSF